MTVKDKSFQFSLLIIRLYKNLIAEKEFIISKQLLRSGTSIGANIEEANAGISKKDFAHKMSIASKEARETLYWLRLLNEGKLVEIDVKNEIIHVNELIKMLTSIVKTTQENLNK